MRPGYLFIFVLVSTLPSSQDTLMSGHHSFQPSSSRGFDRLDIIVFLARQLIEAQNENLRLRREVNQSRMYFQTLRRRLQACLTQIQDVETAIREFILLHRAAEESEGFQLLSDIETDTISSSSRSTAPLGHQEDRTNLEEDAESALAPLRQQH